MNLENELRQHLQDSTRDLPAPPDRLGEVVRRGRRRKITKSAGALGAVIAIAVAVPTGLVLPDRSRVELAPAAPGRSEPPSESRSSESERWGQALSLDQLDAPVLTYGEAGVHIHRDGRDRLVWPEPVRQAYPDGDGGVVLEASNKIVWVPQGDPNRAETLVDEGGERPVLRGLLPDGRAAFSVIDPGRSEDMKERFFAIALRAGAERELLEEAHAFESWTTGPAAVADGTFVHASCHMACTLYPGLAEEPPESEPLYGHRGPQVAIDGLASTPDGAVVAFVTTPPASTETAPPPRLVILDGGSFETLAGIDLPVTPEAQRRAEQGMSMTIPDVSISADGQRVLVSMGSVYLIEDALREPRLSAVDYTGVVRWMDAETQ